MVRIDYERKDLKTLAKEFGVIKVGKYGVKFLPKDPNGHIHKLISITPLTGWITNPKEVERIIRERGLEI